TNGPTSFLGGPVNKIGPGAWVFNGNQTTYGQINVQEGQLTLNINTGQPASPTTAANPFLTLYAQRPTGGPVDSKVVINADQDIRVLHSTFTDPGLQSIDFNSPAAPCAFRSLRVYSQGAKPSVE